ncbi:MAG: hypothetical protein OEY59_09360 [Deltaproteobacteria bacterium]|nr:hypothetical protein [Deltaproteobacteria bacterium]
MENEKNIIKNLFDKFVKEFTDASDEKLGQHWRHSLPGFRDWEVALNVIHLALKSKPHYIGIVTNTRRRLNKLVPGVNFDRRKDDLPSEMVDLFKMKQDTFSELSHKIHDQVLKTNTSKDIWYFTTPWKVFEEGMIVIPLHQKQEKKFVNKAVYYRRAFVILDKNCSVAAQNQIMYIIHKVFEDKQNIKKILRLAALEFVKKPTKKKIRPKYTGRLPGRIIVLLKSNYDNTLRTITDDEKRVLFGYFQFLKDMNEFKSEYERLETRLRSDLSKENGF